MKYYVYHIVPPHMQGTVLYPLNTLKAKHPDIYKHEASKYAGREAVMQLTIPALNCLWNDVLHLSPVPPAAIKAAHVESGKSLELKAYRIDADSLEPDKTVIYLYKYSDRDGKYHPDNWQAFSPDRLKGLQALPQATKDYYRQTFEAGQRPLLYGWVPHVLYKGSIDISGATIVD